MTPAGEGLPEGSEAILPGNDAGIGRATVLEKDETAARFQDTFHLLERLFNVGDGANGPCDHDGVDTRTGERQRLFRGLREKFDRKAPGGHALARHALEFDRRIHAVDTLHLGRVERQI